MVAEDCGIAGFEISGPSEVSLPYLTSEIDLIGCIAVNTGSNGQAIGTACGFKLEKSAFNTDFPKGIRLIDCRAYDVQTVKTMAYGALCDVTGLTGANT